MRRKPNLQRGLSAFLVVELGDDALHSLKVILAEVAQREVLLPGHAHLELAKPM